MLCASRTQRLVSYPSEPPSAISVRAWTLTRSSKTHVLRLRDRFALRAALSSEDVTPTASTDDLVAKVPWYKKPCPEWFDAANTDELEEVLSSAKGKWFVVVDIYAGWCGSCKSAYPAVCKIPTKADLSKKFKFVKTNIEDAGINDFIKKHGVRGIPWMLVFSPAGENVASFGASFKKVETVTQNLVTISNNPGKKFDVDSLGSVKVV